MKTILIGTNSKPKLELYIDLLKEYDVNLITPKNLDIDIDVLENGKTALDNALIKAKTYHQASSGLATISGDSALFFPDFAIDDPIQPLTHVRRPLDSNTSLNDSQMIEYYSELAKMNGGKITACYLSATVIIDENHHIYNIDDYERFKSEDIDLLSFYLVDKPHTRYTPGWPLDSLSMNKNLNKYYFDLTEDEVKNSPTAYQRRFFVEQCYLEIKNCIAKSLQLKLK